MPRPFCDSVVYNHMKIQYKRFKGAMHSIRSRAGSTGQHPESLLGKPGHGDACRLQRGDVRDTCPGLQSCYTLDSAGRPAGLLVG